MPRSVIRKLYKLIVDAIYGSWFSSGACNHADNRASKLGGELLASSCIKIYFWICVTTLVSIPWEAIYFVSSIKSWNNKTSKERKSCSGLSLYHFWFASSAHSTNVWLSDIHHCSHKSVIKDAIACSPQRYLGSIPMCFIYASFLSRDNAKKSLSFLYKYITNKWCDAVGIDSCFQCTSIKSHFLRSSLYTALHAAIALRNSIFCVSLRLNGPILAKSVSSRRARQSDDGDDTDEVISVIRKKNW